MSERAIWKIPPLIRKIFLSGSWSRCHGSDLCGDTVRNDQVSRPDRASTFQLTSHCCRTKLIDDQRSANPRFRNLAHGTATIVREEGILGIYRGLFPVMMRQSANSAIRFSSYSSLKSVVQGSTRPGEQLPAAMTFLLGAAAGTITVYSASGSYCQSAGLMRVQRRCRSTRSRHGCRRLRQNSSTAIRFTQAIGSSRRRVS